MDLILAVCLLFLPLYLMGFVTNSKSLTIFLAVVFGLIASYLAGEEYLYIYLITIVVALYLALSKIDKKNE